MNPRVIEVKPTRDFTVTLTFTNGEVKIFDVKPYLSKGIFRELQNEQVFNAVKPFLGSIQWPGGQDFCPDTLYLDSIPIQNLNPSLRDNKVLQTNNFMHSVPSL